MTTADTAAPAPAWDAAAFAADPQLQRFIYDRLHTLARGQLRHKIRFAQTTSLVHEAYLRLAPTETTPTPGALSREHFFAVAATVMRQILIDRARAAQAAKRGGGVPELSLDAAEDALQSDEPADVLRVDSALERVRALDPRLATLVELKVFGGFEVTELADALSMSERSVKRYWRRARALLLLELET